MIEFPYSDSNLPAQGDDIVSIPGTKRRKYLEENIAVVEISLTPDELDRINEVAPKSVARGDRYSTPQLEQSQSIR